MNESAGSSVCLDYSGNGYNGEYSVSVRPYLGVAGPIPSRPCVRFSAEATETMIFPAAAEITGGGTRTILMVVNLRAVDEEKRGVYHGGTEAVGQDLLISFWNSGGASLWHNGWGIGGNDFNVAYPHLNKWAMIAFTYDSGNRRYYFCELNPAAPQTFTLNHNDNFTINTGSNYRRVGHGRWGGASADIGYVAHLPVALDIDQLNALASAFLDGSTYFGTVRDQNGDLAIGRTVQVIRESDRACVWHGVTDSNGGFSSGVVLDEPHTLIFDGEPDRNALIYRGVMPGEP